MRRYAQVVAIIAMLIVGVGSASVSAQSINPSEMTRGMAQTYMMKGKAYLDGGRYTDAAAEFEEVWYMDDPDHEISDIRAAAGVFLCLARAKANQMSAAREACTRVIQMPDAPQEIKRQASTLLGKLN